MEADLQRRPLKCRCERRQMFGGGGRIGARARGRTRRRPRNDCPGPPKFSGARARGKKGLSPTRQRPPSSSIR
eukprot:2444229-Rhodomonas_salina.5